MQDTNSGNTIAPEQKKVILQVLCSSSIGGLEFFTLDVAKKLEKMGHDSIIISPNSDIVVKCAQLGITHYKMNVASKNIITILLNAKQMINIIRREKVDIVHVKSRAPSWSCYIACKITGTKLITSFHGLYDLSNMLIRLYHYPMMQGERIVAVSHFIKEQLSAVYKNLPEGKIRIIPDGMNPKRYKPIENKTQANEIKNDLYDKYHVKKDSVVIVFPGRMVPRKGHLVLINAIKKINHNKIYCILTGNMDKYPEYVAMLRDEIFQSKMQHSIRLFGHEKNMVELYNIADIVLSISVKPEASGRVIMEAQSMKKLVIATNIGVIPENIEDNENGFLIPPDDSDILAKKIQDCISILGTKEHKRITENACNTIKTQHSTDIMFKRTLEMYNEL